MVLKRITRASTTVVSKRITRASLNIPDWHKGLQMTDVRVANGPCCSLPDHLVDMILAKLPIPELFRMRAVCKRWNRLTRLPSFLELYAQLPREHLYYVYCRSKVDQKLTREGNGPMRQLFDDFRGIREFLVLCPSTNKWYNMPLDFLPFKVFYPVSTSAGLLLVLVYKENGVITLAVCNPLTKCWAELPPWNDKRSTILPEFTALVVDKIEHSYMVILIDGKADLVTQVYNSFTKAWKKTDTLCARRHLPWSVIQVVESNGVMCCLASAGTQIMTYDLERNIWKKYSWQVPKQLPNGEVTPAVEREPLGLVQIGGRLLFITAISWTNVLEIWELDPMSNFSCISMDQITCAASPDTLPLANFVATGDYELLRVAPLYTVEDSEALCFGEVGCEDPWVYDLSKRSWVSMSLAPDAKQLNTMDHHILDIYSTQLTMEMRLDMPV